LLGDGAPRYVQMFRDFFVRHIEKVRHKDDFAPVCRERGQGFGKVAVGYADTFTEYAENVCVRKILIRDGQARHFPRRHFRKRYLAFALPPVPALQVKGVAFQTPFAIAVKDMLLAFFVAGGHVFTSFPAGKEAERFTPLLITGHENAILAKSAQKYFKLFFDRR
jgi:hypothetical protein